MLSVILAQHTTYAFQGIARWTFGFENPNAAGCMAAMIWTLCWHYGSVERRCISILLFLSEGLLIWGLCMTFSRGALVAAVSALSMHAISASRIYVGANKTIIKHLLARLSVLVMAVIASGLAKRISVPYIATDRSVLNRFGVWVGALKMISMRPLFGWNSPDTGWLYYQWASTQSETVRVNDMVSGALEVAVRYGILASYIIFSVPAVFLFYTNVNKNVLGTLSGNYLRLMLSAEAAILVFCLTNITSYLFNTVLLSSAGICVIYCIAILYKSRARTPWRLLLITSTVFLSLSWIGVAVVRKVNDDVQVALKDGIVTLSRPTDSRSKRQYIIIIPDRVVLGLDYGRRLRLAFRDLSKVIFEIYTYQCDIKQQINRLAADGDATVVLFGAASDLGNMVTGKRVILVHPIGNPLHAPANKVRSIVLPMFSDTDTNDLWWRWANDNDIHIISTVGGVRLQGDVVQVLRDTL